MNSVTPYWQSDCGRVTIYVGRCEEVAPCLEQEQFHALVTDPPYGLGKEPDPVEVMRAWTECGHYEVAGAGFMGKEWDAFVPQPAMWRPCLATVKPGGHVVCFAGTRTLDWMGMSLRFAGAQYRDTIMWVYGSGWPKAPDASKAIDADLGFERDRVPFHQNESWRRMEGRTDRQDTAPSDEPVTETARQWKGWSSALKPALEPVILARKPMPSSVSKCLVQHGTGALNVNGCAVGTEEMPTQSSSKVDSTSQSVALAGKRTRMTQTGTRVGRWPANLIHDGSDEVVHLFPQEAGGGNGKPMLTKGIGGAGKVMGGSERSGAVVETYADSGSAARFFYTTKASTEDRPHGRDGVVHPTVKPLDLMQYLIRLVCVKGGTVFDPFMGSGSTGCAAVLEGMWFVGIEQDKKYADIAVGKIKLALSDAGPAGAQFVAGIPKREDGNRLPAQRLRRNGG